MGTNLDLAWLVSRGASGVQQVSVFASLLGAMRDLRNANTETVEWHEALGKLFQALDDQGSTAPKGVDQTDWDALKADWTTLKQRLRERLPDALQPLTFKLSDLAPAKIGNSTTPGLLEYPLIARTVAGKTSVAAAGLMFDVASSIAADTALSIQVYDAAPAWAQEVGYQLPGAMNLVRVGAHGSLAAGADAAASPAWGKVSLSAGAHAAAALDYCLHFPASRYLAQVLLDSIPQLRAPGDLNGFLEVCKSNGTNAFAMSVFDISGGLTFGGSVTLGKALVQQISIDPQTLKKVATGLAIDLPPPPTVAADVGAALGFKWALDGDYRTTVRKFGDGAAVRIDRLTARTTGASLTVDATFDIDGLQAMLDPVMTKFLPTAEPLLARLGELADLRGLARSALQRQLGLTGTGGWTDIANQLLDLALGGAPNAAATQIGATLNTMFTDFANGYLQRIGADPATLKSNIDALVQQANKVLLTAQPAAGAAGGDTAAASAQITAALKAITTRIDQAYKRFTDQVASVSNDVARTIVAPIAPVGAEIGAFIQQLQGKVNTATEPLVAWLTRYEMARTKVAKAVEQVEREKLAIDWGVTYQKRRESTALVEVLFAQPGAAGPTAKAQALFNAMLTGRLDNYPALIAQCTREGSATEQQCLFRIGQTRSTVYSFSLNLFGFTSITTTSSAADNVVVEVDGMGRITAAGSTAQLGNRMTVGSKTTDASLTIDLEMLAADAAPRLSAIFTASGDSFTRKDRDDFFALLELSGAVTAGTNVRVRDLLWAGATNDATALTHAELSVLYAPDLDAWRRMLAVKPDVLEAATRRRCMDLLGIAMKVKAEPGLLGTSDPAAWAAEWAAQKGIKEADFWAGAKATSTWSGWYESLFDRTPSPSASIPLERSVKRMWQLARISAGVADAWKNVALEEQFLSGLLASPDRPKQAGVFDRLSDLSERIKKGFATTVQFEIADLSKPTKVSWQFLAPILALAAFGEEELGPPLITRVKAVVRAQTIDELIV
ncbi:MAG TPA: hypothetical protein VLW55_01745 [Burkholderiaceae bacterium]|nr:hypothetical protein [Burkholderiaceae bacterium]